MTILEISKTCVLKKTSTVLKPFTQPHRDMFDTSNCAPDKAYEIPWLNEKIPGLM